MQNLGLFFCQPTGSLSDTDWISETGPKVIEMKSYINFTLFGIDIGWGWAWGLTEIPFDKRQFSRKTTTILIPFHHTSGYVVVHILIRQKSPDMTKRQKMRTKTQRRSGILDDRAIKVRHVVSPSSHQYGIMQSWDPISSSSLWLCNLK